MTESGPNPKQVALRLAEATILYIDESVCFGKETFPTLFRMKCPFCGCIKTTVYEKSLGEEIKCMYCKRIFQIIDVVMTITDLSNTG